MWFRNNYCLKHHSPRCVAFSVPNEVLQGTPKQRAKEIMQKKQTGLLNGAADFIVVIPGRTIYFETKTPTGTQSKAQKDFQSALSALNQEYYVIRSLDDFQKIVEKALSPQ